VFVTPAFFVAGAAFLAHHPALPEPWMASGESEDREGPGPSARWPAAVASLAVGAAFFALWCWLLPSWLGFHVSRAGAARWRWLLAAPAVLGFAVALRCVWDFAWKGQGTPAPVAPPKRLVVAGFYRYVRNPMYLGFFTGWVGLWVVFGRASLVAIAVACAVVLGTALFVLLYEEPKLRETFGAEYEEYCRNVPRWVPRMRAWRRQS
jgi:protein-S-isoprenylcysteine O-methyltransferase Ste14